MKVYGCIALWLCFLAPLVSGAAGSARKDWTPKKISREELITRTRLVILATRLPENDVTLSPSPCLSISEGYRVDQVLRKLSGNAIAPGDKIQVLPYRFYMLKHRCSKVGYVKTFEQFEYDPSTEPKAGEPVILFLEEAFNGFYYATLNSREGESEEAAIVNASPYHCEELKGGYLRALGSLPADCQADNDCKAYSYDTVLSGCGNEVFKSHELSPSARRLTKLYSNLAGKLCPAPFVACERIPVKPACRAGQCVNLLRQPDSSSFASGEIQNSCSPHDGAAIVFTANVKGEAAYAAVSLYSEKIPVVGKPYQISWGDAPGSNRPEPKGTISEMRAVYCSGKATCVPAVSGTFSLEEYKGMAAPSNGSFEFSLPAGVKIGGKLRYQPRKTEKQPFCG